MACYSDARALRTTWTQRIGANPVNYYAHTANNNPLRLERGEGQGEVSKSPQFQTPHSALSVAGEGWQPLNVHLRNVANLATQFAAPLGLADKAEPLGLLHR